ncbi:MAG: hypothetical protein BWY71_01176 [Planctomycetes bacterium ADurb.Bin412]|nr:MAG: hypothetical protein BWY71_01176 [Planctomycetes bacterium ADurb.Bin412]
MSHFTKVKTVIREREVLCEALRALHHRFREGERLIVNGYQDNTETAEVVVHTGCKYDIGFQRQRDGVYAAVADWNWGIRREAAPRFHQDAFLGEINQKYAHLNVRRQARIHGWPIEEERVLDDGTIEVVVCENI